MPLIPGFAGEPEESATIQFICKHTYAGICNNYDLGLVEQLQKIMGNKWKNYLGFYSLRNHCLVNGIPKTEIIYIHSKLIIVDDTKVLIGSANINDRSLLGNRDSEFAVLIKEKRLSINNKCNRNFLMNGKKYLGSNFATNFRKDLMAEHLGLSSNDLFWMTLLVMNYLILLFQELKLIPKHIDIYSHVIPMIHLLILIF